MQPFERLLPPNILHCLAASPGDFHVEVCKLSLLTVKGGQNQ
jgi:hypothetical protein